MKGKYLEKVDLEGLIKSKGREAALIEGIACNDNRILSPTLSAGFEICRERTRIVDAVAVNFFRQLQAHFPDNQDIVLGATGGYGRMELEPNSDVDLILIANSITPQISEYSSAFANHFFYSLPKISGHIIVNTLDDIPQFELDKIAAFLDLRFLAGSKRFYRRVRRQLRDYTDPLEFIGGLSSELKKQHEKHDRGIFDARSFNVKYGIGGIRHFHMGIWVEGVRRFTPSVELYAEAPKDVMDAVGYMLRLRGWLNLRKGLQPTSPDNDELTYDDRVAFGEAFGEEGLEMLVASRKRIRQFAEANMYRRLKKGIAIDNGLEHGIGGIRISKKGKTEDQNNIFYRLMFHAQKRGIPIDSDAYHYFLSDACSFVRADPAFLDLFYDKGSLATTLRNFSRFNVLGKIWPGFSKLEAALYERGHRNWHITKAGQAIRRIENLESLNSNNQGNASPQTRFFMGEYENLEPEQLFALRLALLCKGIPQVLGITTRDYTEQLHNVYPQIASSALDTMVFLIENKDTLFTPAQSYVVDDPATVAMLTTRVDDVRQLRSLLLFTYADLGHGKQKRFTPEQWENALDIYKNSMRRLMKQEQRPYDPFALDEEGRAIASSMPEGFLQSRYVGRLVTTYIGWLRKVKYEGNPQIRFAKTYSNKTALLEIAAEDFPGLLWRITGTCYKHGMSITQAQIYSLKEPHKLALDFLNLAIPDGIDEGQFKKDIASIISSRGDLELPELDIAKIVGQADVELEHLPEAGYVRMTMAGADQLGLLYAVTRTLSEKIGADIYATNAYTSREGRIRNIILFKSDKGFKDLTGEMAKYFSVKAA